MATWDNLTQEQRDIYEAFEIELRGSMIRFHSVLNEFRELDNMYNSQVLAILADLDDNTIVPNPTNLAGSASLDSDSEMVTLVSHAQSAVTNYDTVGHRNLRNRAGGINATI